MVQIDVRLDEVVLRALEKDPERRYQQASQVRRTWRHCPESRRLGSHGEEAGGSPVLGWRTAGCGSAT